jgi:ribosomal protein S8E
MGGQKRHFKGNNRSADKKRRKENAERWKNTRGDDRDKGDGTSGRWALTAAGNKRFDAFYRAQGFIGEDEWDNFKSSLVAPLPACFRINPDYAFADELERQLLGLVGQRMEIDGVEIHPVQKMAWYPHAFKLGTDRRSIRKLPALEGLHKWMMVHTDCGNITRQEAGKTTSSFIFQ